jgi:hypothetical protein
MPDKPLSSREGLFVCVEWVSARIPKNRNPPLLEETFA